MHVLSEVRKSDVRFAENVGLRVVALRSSAICSRISGI